MTSTVILGTQLAQIMGNENCLFICDFCVFNTGGGGAATGKRSSRLKYCLLLGFLQATFVVPQNRGKHEANTLLGECRVLNSELILVAS